MAEYFSTFITGFEQVVSTELARDLKGVKIIGLHNGLVHYSYGGGAADVASVFYLNNSYLIFKAFGKETLEQMAARAFDKNFRPLTKKGSFRFRFSEENKFVRVPEKTAVRVEDAVMQRTGLSVNRHNPDTEFWFLTRREGFGFFCQLLDKAVKTKPLNKGELRPELAYLLCKCADFTPESVVCDPFAGYGAIPLQITRRLPHKKLYVNDNDVKCFSYLQKTKLGKNKKVELTNINALELSHIENGDVDLIITDPPWGVYKNVENNFYDFMFKEFKRILIKDGKIVLLLNQNFETDVIEGNGLAIKKDFPILVSGKRARVLTSKHKFI